MKCPECDIKLTRVIGDPRLEYSPHTKIGEDIPFGIVCVISVEYECLKCGILLETNKHIVYKKEKI